MNKEQFIEWIKDNTPDSAIFECPMHSVERPIAKDYGCCGNDHNGFAVMRPISFYGVGSMEVTYHYNQED